MAFNQSPIKKARHQRCWAFQAEVPYCLRLAGCWKRPGGLRVQSRLSRRGSRCSGCFGSGFFRGFLRSGFFRGFLRSGFFRYFFGCGFLRWCFFGSGFFSRCFFSSYFFRWRFFRRRFFGSSFFSWCFFSGYFFRWRFFSRCFFGRRFFSGYFFCRGFFRWCSFFSRRFFRSCHSFLLLTLQRALHVWSTRSDSRCWASGKPGPALRTRKQSPTRTLWRCYWSLQFLKSCCSCLVSNVCQLISG